jgi:hypothetical protein
MDWASLLEEVQTQLNEGNRILEEVLAEMGIARSTYFYHKRRLRLGINTRLPKDAWLTPAENDAIRTIANSLPGLGVEMTRAIANDMGTLALPSGTFVSALRRLGLREDVHPKRYVTRVRRITSNLDASVLQRLSPDQLRLAGCSNFDVVVVMEPIAEVILSWASYWDQDQLAGFIKHLGTFQMTGKWNLCREIEVRNQCDHHAGVPDRLACSLPDVDIEREIQLLLHAGGRYRPAPPDRRSIEDSPVPRERTLGFSARTVEGVSRFVRWWNLQYVERNGEYLPRTVALRNHISNHLIRLQRREREELAENERKRVNREAKQNELIRRSRHIAKAAPEKQRN